MIAKLIRWSITNRFPVLLATLMVSGWGVYSVLKTPLDALPDLSDVQVIIRTTYPGQAPRIVEDQITYPLTTTMLSVPGAKSVPRMASAIVTRASLEESRSLRILRASAGCGSVVPNNVIGVPYANTARIPVS